MFGYQHAELIGHSVESLIPAQLREAHRGHRTSPLPRTARQHRAGHAPT
jgi:hypothetical protein